MPIGIGLKFFFFLSLVVVRSGARPIGIRSLGVVGVNVVCM